MKELTDRSLNDYSKNFLDIPEFDAEFYARAVKQLFVSFLKNHPLWSLVILICILGPIAYVWTLPDYMVWFDTVWSYSANIWKAFWNTFPTSGKG